MYNNINKLDAVIIIVGLRCIMNRRKLYSNAAYPKLVRNMPIIGIIKYPGGEISNVHDDVSLISFSCFSVVAPIYAGVSKW